jgi:hypothetical protein
MKDGKQLEYKTIKSNVLEKNISVEERIKGLDAYTAPDLTENSRNISSPRTVGPPLIPSVNALNLVNYTFQSNLDSATYAKYFNGVIDGYYFPTTSGFQNIIVDITNELETLDKKIKIANEKFSKMIFFGSTLTAEVVGYSYYGLKTLYQSKHGIRRITNGNSRYIEN